jgi:glycosyltransferase involved in cell wall biosynthesis
MCVRNEAWILGLSLRAVLQWADAVVVLDHASTDETPASIEAVAGEYPGRVIRLYEPGDVWEEMRHRHRMLEAAREAGATHIGIVDADEVLTGNLVPEIRRLFDATGPGAVLQLPWICLRGSILAAHTEGVWANQQASIGFQDSPELHWAARAGYDFHHREPMGARLDPYKPVPGIEYGGLMHLQFASRRRLRAKQALYKITEVLRWPGREPVEVVDQRYNLAVYGAATKQESCGKLEAVPNFFWEGYENLIQHIDVDAKPWQENAVYQAIKDHGRDRFAGLDLFGLV